MKKIIPILTIVLILLVAAFYFLEKEFLSEKVEVRENHPKCLREGERADIKQTEKNNDIYTVILDIAVKNSLNEIVQNFQINDAANSYHVYHLSDCGIYTIRSLPGDFRIELWHYNFASESRKIITLASKDSKGEIEVYYSFDFRIDPLEKYSALIKDVSSDPFEQGYAINDLKTAKDIFVLPHSTILKTHPEFNASLGLKDWTRSGDHFWSDIFAGASILGFVRIERDTWNYDILPAPEGTQGGDALNLERGWVTYDTGPGWIGIDVLAEKIYDQWRRDGKIVELYVYNLFTKEKRLVATSSDPSWWGTPFWISDIELQYEMPSGEKKIYTINEK